MAPPSRSTDCPSEEAIARFLGGESGPDDRARIEQHLATCRTCPELVGNVARANSVALAATMVPDIDAVSPPIEAGTRVGRYVMGGALGAGAMGRVYAAYDPTLDRQVAVKLLHGSANDAHREARLLREAKAMARLARQPEVVPVYDAGKHGAQLFIAMELVAGGTLRAWLAAHPRTLEEVVAVFQQAGKGLAHAHAAGLVHRDFKPDNVLVGRDGRARVTDFGLARVLREAPDVAPTSSRVRRAGAANEASLTHTGTLVGTPAYMAPEQLTGVEADVRSDIFSFCVAFYEALYGERPFAGSTVTGLRESTLSGRFSPPRGQRAVPWRLRRVLEIGLRPRPEDRHASMVALLDAVDRATRPPTARRLGTAGALFAAAGAAVSVLLLHRSGSPQVVANPAMTAILGSDTATAPVAPAAAAGASVTPGAPGTTEPREPSPPRAAPVRPAARSKLASRQGLALEDAGALESGGPVEQQVVEGRNGAPIMR